MALRDLFFWEGESEGKLAFFFGGVLDFAKRKFHYKGTLDRDTFGSRFVPYSQRNTNAKQFY